MTITLEKKHKLSQTELAALAGLPENATREQIDRAFLDKAAEMVDLPDGSSPGTIRRELLQSIGVVAQEMVGEGSLIGRYLRWASRHANWASADFNYDNGAKVTVKITGKGRRERVNVKGTYKTVTVLRP